MATQSTARPTAASTAPPRLLSVEEYRRLSWLRAACLAADHLATHGPPADRQAARRLAFGLWLHATGRLDGEFTRTAGG